MLKKIDLLSFLTGVVGNPKYKLSIANQNTMSSEKTQKNGITKMWDKITGIFVPPSPASRRGDGGEVKKGEETETIRNARDASICPYCMSTNFVKRGTRKNKNQVVQLYLCRNFGCGRTFTAQDIKGKHFPLLIIIESMSYYNLGLTLEETCKIIKQKFGVAPEPATLSDWINEYKELCRYERLRPYAIKMFGPKDVVEVTTMAHRQLYRFRYHRAKTILMLDEFKNRVLSPLKSYLDNVSSETPHQYFQDGERMSEIRSKFDKADMIVNSKFNYANRLTAFVLQSIPDNKERHEHLQRFMLANDSCTVATEVPVYIRREDVEHMENVLKFKISDNKKITLKGGKEIDLPKLLTGHIDFVCAWFDEKDYYQFYPLHVVKKISDKTKKRRRVFYRDGSIAEVPRENELTIIPRLSKNLTNAPP